MYLNCGGVYLNKIFAIITSINNEIFSQNEMNLCGYLVSFNGQLNANVMQINLHIISCFNVVYVF